MPILFLSLEGCTMTKLWDATNFATVPGALSGTYLSTLDDTNHNINSYKNNNKQSSTDGKLVHRAQTNHLHLTWTTACIVTGYAKMKHTSHAIAKALYYCVWNAACTIPWHGRYSCIVTVLVNCSSKQYYCYVAGTRSHNVGLLLGVTLATASPGPLQSLPATSNIRPCQVPLINKIQRNTWSKMLCHTTS